MKNIQQKAAKEIFILKLNFTSKRNIIYWFCQTGGWAVYVIVNLIITNVLYKADLNILSSFVILGIMGIGFTHLYRYFIKKYHWLKLSLKQIVPLVFSACILMALLMTGGLFVVGILKGALNNRMVGFTLLNNSFEFMMVTLLWSLLYFAFHYMENYRNSEIEKLVWEAAVKDFELKTLKSQLNPHFMFNALNSIRALIEENPERAKKAIGQLSSIFRYSLKIERMETTPLFEELKTVEDYLGLEKVRYEERLHYSITTSPESEKIEIPPMMVQTLVENGIKHGVAKLPEGGSVTVNTVLEKDFLVITITNSGKLNESEMANTKGFGLSNTKHRLFLLYGTKASFFLTENNNRVKAEIFIPIGVR